MRTALGEFLDWVVQISQSILDFFITTLSDVAEGIAKIAVSAWEGLARSIDAIPDLLLLLVPALLVVYIGIKMRLKFRGLLLYAAGLGIIIFGLLTLSF